jgi:hypothetical protein
MEKLYTKNIHTRFQYEMSYTMSYNIRRVAENTYEVYCITHFVPGYHNSTYQVYADPPMKLTDAHAANLKEMASSAVTS